MDRSDPSVHLDSNWVPLGDIGYMTQTKGATARYKFKGRVHQVLVSVVLALNSHRGSPDMGRHDTHGAATYAYDGDLHDR